MVATSENVTATAAAQSPTPEIDSQANRARTNAGDTVRASWPFSLDSIRENISHVSPEARELLIWAFTWCIDSAHAMRLEEFAERVGYAQNTVYKIYSGKYLHPETKERMDVPEKLVKAIRDFRRIEVQRAKLGRNKFVVTPTAKRVFLACDLARESQTPVFIEGASHIGKTEAFRQYCVENDHGKSILVELEAVSGLMGIVRAIAVKLGVSPNGNTPDLIDRIKKALTPDMVLILDEVHLLANTYRKGSFFACMETVRRIYDFCQCGLVLSFTKLGYDKAEKERKRELEQIFRRGVHRVNLGDRPTRLDVEAILGSWGLELPALNEDFIARIGRTTITEQPYKIVQQLAAEQGLKAIVERLRYAAKFAADGEDDLTWEHFIRAHVTVQKNGQQPEHGWAQN